MWVPYDSTNANADKQTTILTMNETNLTLFSTGYFQSLLTAIFSPCNRSLDWVTELHFQRFLLFICNNHAGQDRLSQMSTESKIFFLLSCLPNLLYNTIKRNVTWRSRYFCPIYTVIFNPLHPNISMHILHTVLIVFLKVMSRRTCLKIRGFSVG